MQAEQAHSGEADLATAGEELAAERDEEEEKEEEDKEDDDDAEKAAELDNDDGNGDGDGACTGSLDTCLYLALPSILSSQANVFAAEG